MTIISDKYMELGGSKLGKLVSEERSTKNGGRYVELEQVINGQIDTMSIYYHRKTGPHLVRGLIRQKWLMVGGLEKLGYPLTDEIDTEDGQGRYNDFQKGSIYYRKGEPEAFMIWGPIRKKWRTVGGVRFLGYPTTDERSVEGSAPGRYNDFKSAREEERDQRSIYWHPKTGAHVVRGAIHYEWLAKGGVTRLGYPITDEEDYIGKNGQKGRISRFQKGAIIHYWDGASTYVSYEKSQRIWFSIRAGIVIILALIWGASCAYALITKNVWLFGILLPSGGAITAILDYLFQKMGKRVIDFFLPNDDN